MPELDGKETAETQVPEGGTTPEEEGAKSKETASTPDPLTLERSRAAGLDAKVTELTKSEATLKSERDALAKEISELRSGEVNKDEALKVLLAAKDEELAEERRATQIARIEAKFPETFGVFGENVANMSEDQLAAAEARFAGVQVEGEPPTPRGTQAPKSSGTTTVAAAKEPSSADIMAKLTAMGVPAEWGGV